MFMVFEKLILIDIERLYQCCFSFRNIIMAKQNGIPCDYFFVCVCVCVRGLLASVLFQSYFNFMAVRFSDIYLVNTSCFLYFFYS